MKSRDKIPQFKVGDTVRVHFRIVEGEKERTQVFEGVVISRSGGEGPQARFTVRRVAYNEGVERVFPLHSPRLENVKVVRQGSVRRAKLHYLRERSGKSARVKAMGRAGQIEGGEAGAELVEESAPPEETGESGAAADSEKSKPSAE
jgi:large subunit ribosomal protein L19